MTSFANFPAASVAAAATTFANRRRQEAEADGVRGTNFAAIYDAEALAKLARACGDGQVSVSRDDFGFIEADYQALSA